MGVCSLKDLKKYITDIPGFPKEGIIFRDVTSLLQNGEGFSSAVDEMLKQLDDVDFDAVIGLEARGFLFGAPIAYAKKKGFVPVRKKGKLPRTVVSAEYALEYGTAEVEMHTDSLKKGDKVVIVDDLIATGGTIEAAAKMVEQLGGEVVRIVCLIELTDLKGREKLSKYDVRSIVTYEGE